MPPRGDCDGDGGDGDGDGEKDILGAPSWRGMEKKGEAAKRASRKKREREREREHGRDR